MTRLRDFQNAFVRALEQGDEAPLGPYFQEEATAVKNRFAIYRNNVTHSLTEALKAAYPVVAQLVGEEFFTATARVWLKDNLPQQATLVEYGASFPEFLDRFEPAQSVPYLGAVARLERAWLQAGNAANAEPLAPVALTRLAPDTLPDLRLRPHPSLRLVTVDWPVNLIWEAHRKDPARKDGETETAGSSPPLRIEARETHLVVVRPRLQVMIQPVSPGTMVLLHQFSDGETLGKAAQAAMDREAGFDLQDALQGLLTTGVFAGFYLNDEVRAEK